VCAAGVAEKLLHEGHEITGFFFNPNIQPLEEYQVRLDVAQKVSKEMGYALNIGDYRPKEWLKETLPFRNEPEGGYRCEVCFRIRLGETNRQLSKLGGDMFTTTLTVSPRKSAQIINRIGREIGGQLFLERDFKKKEGFKRSVELAKQWHLHRQDYCGCIYSFRERSDKDEPKDQRLQS